MARKARIKTPDGIYHIICKSITEVTLFVDGEDKAKYLALIKKYKELYKVKIYGYCLMDTHAHLMIDANGCDISKVMHGINFSYAMYYNRKYNRDGHLFKDRFMSKIVDNDRYLRTLSLYIHNNPKDIAGFKDCPEKYEFSSLGIYMGKSRDLFNLVDYEFVMGFFDNDLEKARKKYSNLIVNSNKDELKEDFEFKEQKTEYKSQQKILVRNIKPENIIEFIALKMNISKILLNTKYSRNLVVAKALTVVLMRSLCNYKSSEICRILGNITQARISKLSTIGIELIGSEKKYENIITDFIEYYA